MTKKVKEVIRLLEQNGWVFIGIKGDHRKYYKVGARRPIKIINMKTLSAIIESSKNNYSAYIDGLDGVTATGSTIDEIKTNLTDSLEDLICTCKEMNCPVPDELKDGYILEFKMDVKSLFDLYSGVFTKSGIERLTGINQKQLWHYASGKSTPRKTQIEKIEMALHKLGRELLAVHL